MIITFEKVQCWSPASSFNVFLEKSAPIDLSSISPNSPQYIQVGPYRVKIEIQSSGGGINSLRLGTTATTIQNIAASGAVTGSVFVFLPDAVEMISNDGTFRVLGSASGCFEIHW